MKFNFNAWNMGGKVIFISSTVALLSLLFAWVDIGIMSQNGFSQGTFLLFGLFIYPVYKLLNNDAINKKIGLSCGGAAIALTIIYIGSKTGELFGKTVNVSGTGAYLFLIASIALTYGITKYQQTMNTNTNFSNG